MNKRMRFILLAAVVVVLFAAVFLGATAPTLAQSGGGYDLTWNVIGGGGATFSTGGGYSLGGTIGQAVAGGPATGGSYSLNSGFWAGVTNWLSTYLPLIRR
jgi:hypothetical protein